MNLNQFCAELNRSVPPMPESFDRAMRQTLDAIVAQEAEEIYPARKRAETVAASWQEKLSKEDAEAMERARKDALTQAHAPLFVHVATHGFARRMHRACQMGAHGGERRFKCDPAAIRAVNEAFRHA